MVLYIPTFPQAEILLSYWQIQFVAYAGCGCPLPAEHSNLYDLLKKISGVNIGIALVDSQHPGLPSAGFFAPSNSGYCGFEHPPSYTLYLPARQAAHQYER